MIMKIMVGTLPALAPVVFQRVDRRKWNPEVPTARDPGGAASCASPHPHQEIPGQQRHHYVVQNLPVGGHISQVNPDTALYM